MSKRGYSATPPASQVPPGQIIKATELEQIDFGITLSANRDLDPCTDLARVEPADVQSAHSIRMISPLAVIAMMAI